MEIINVPLDSRAWENAAIEGSFAMTTLGARLFSVRDGRPALGLWQRLPCCTFFGESTLTCALFRVFMLSRRGIHGLGRRSFVVLLVLSARYAHMQITFYGH